jgi:hypothetical protein
VRGERFGAVAIRFGHSEAVEAHELRPLARDEVVTRLYARLGPTMKARSLALAISSRTHSEATRAEAQRLAGTAP